MDNRGKILIVDDEEGVRKSLALVLREEGYQTVTSSSGEEAVEILKQEVFDLVLTDLKMKEIDGLQVLDITIRENPGTPVILITGYASIGSAIQAIRRGAYDYLVKPVEIEDLQMRVKRGIEKRKADLREKELQEELAKKNLALHQKVEELNALYKIGIAFNSPFDLQKLLNQIVLGAAKVVKAQTGSVMLLDEDSSTLFISAAIGLDQETIQKTRLKLGESIAGFVFQKGKPVLVKDIEKDPRFRRINKERYETRSLVSVPLKVGDRILGVLNMSNKKSGQVFDKRDLRVLSTFAAEATIAVENAKLIEQLQKRLSEFSILYEIACGIGEADSLERAIEIIVQSLGKIVNIEQWLWLTWNSESGSFHVKFKKNVDELTLKHLEEFKWKSEEGTSPLIHCWDYLSCQEEFKKDCPVFRTNLSQACWLVIGTKCGGRSPGSYHQKIGECTQCIFYQYAHRGEWNLRLAEGLEKLLKNFSFQNSKLKSFLAVPMMVKGELYGAFCVGSSRDIPFSLAEKKLFSIVASQAASLYEKPASFLKSSQLVAMGEIVSEIAHDLRRPLTIIKGTLDLLQNRWEEESFRNKSMEMIREEVNRLKKLTGELLEFSTPARYFLRLMDAREILDKVLGLVKESLNQHRIILRKEYAENIVPVLMNESQLMAAFLNIIVNAIQAMPEGGEIRITAFLYPKDIERPTHLRIDFSDTGLGIPAEDLSKIFDPFFTTKRSGTGLGLAAVERIVKTHQGYVEVKSEVGKGTTFSINLPLPDFLRSP